MIYVTGDLHGNEGFQRLKQQWLKEKLTAKDFLVICGDAGFCWIPTNEQAPELWAKHAVKLEAAADDEQKRIRWLSNQKWTTLFIDGNHENFPRLLAYPVRAFYGGKSGQLAKKVWHLRRGEVYTIDGKKIFAMGGALSIDKDRRTPGVSWWPEEMPAGVEWDNAKQNLISHGWKVDYVFSHCPPESVRKQVPVHFEERYAEKVQDGVNDGLESIRRRLKFQNWYFGHHHKDMPIGRKFWALYRDIVVAGGPPTQKAQINYQMIQAAKLGLLDKVEHWVTQGADVSKLPAELKRDACTHLLFRSTHFSSRNMHSAAKFIRNGADMNARDKEGNTPLLLAAMHEGTYVARVLLKHGADPDAVNNAGVSVLAALQKRQKETLEQLSSIPSLQSMRRNTYNGLIKLVRKGKE